MTKQADLVKNFFDNSATYLRCRHGIQLRTDMIRELTQDIPVKYVLDIGCGDGSLSLIFSKQAEALVLVDISSSMLDEARRKTPQEELHKYNFVQSEFGRLHFDRENQFDLIIAVGLLAHVESVSSTIKRISRCLKKGGHAIIQFTDEERFFSRINLWFGSSRSSYEINRIRHSEMVNLMSDNSLEVIKQIRYALVLPGFGKLGDKILYQWNKFTRSNTIINRFATDVLMFVRKE